MRDKVIFQNIIFEKKLKTPLYACPPHFFTQHIRDITYFYVIDSNDVNTFISETLRTSSHENFYRAWLDNTFWIET